MAGPTNDPYYSVRLALVRQINQDRASAGVQPVQLDSLSSTVGDHHCQEMAADRYVSHWDLGGLLPYHRYHLAGGRDYVQENLSGITLFSSRPNPIDAQPRALLPLLLQAHARFLAEKPPLNGHRRNVLDPAHTHVGVGLGVVGEEFTMAEEFINRYVRLGNLPAILPNGPIRVEGDMLRKDYGPYFCALFYEGVPRPRTVPELDRTYAYSDTGGDLCASVRPWEMQFNPSRGRFRFSIPPRHCGPGLYHLLFWVRRDIRSIPYALSPGVNRVDTKQGVPAAGWVFRK